jgi:hypothetical protein
MSGHYVRTNDAMLGQLDKMHGKCPMSDRYFKLWLVTDVEGVGNPDLYIIEFIDYSAVL